MDIRRPKMLAGREHPAYKNKQHSEQAFEKLNQMRKMGKLCDVTLLAGDTEILAHRAVLASCSPYFYAMFNAEMAESKAEKVTLHQIDPAALSMLIDFVYTSEIHVTEDNVQTLLPASNLLQLTEVQEACCEFLQSQLHPSNCLGIKDFADLHDCTELLNYTQTYIEQHFSEVVYYDEFLSLTACQVSKLIASDRLTVPSEEQVFEAVLSWIEHDTENRQLSIAELMEHVRLPLMSQEFLVQRVECEPMIKSNTQCKDLLIEAMKYHLLKAEQKALFKTPRTLPRTPIGLPKVLLVLGGQAPKAIKSVECYDFKEERWYQLAEMPIRRCRCGVAVVNGLVYVVGGFSGSLRVRTVDAYDPVKDVWITCQSMKARRSTLGVALLNDLIYAVGGFDGSSGLDGAECYDVKTGLWKSVAPMSIRRSSVGVGVVGGVYLISSWAHLVNAHSVPGDGVIKGLKKSGMTDSRACVLIAEMSSAGNLAEGEYTKSTIKMAEEHSDFVIGFICQKKLLSDPKFIHMTPGVKMSAGKDDLGQQYLTPEKAICVHGSDAIIVGRGIIEDPDPVVAAKNFQAAAYAAYETQVE